ncbi:hypothetical protein O181_073442 [Austropuccinia psidii MF-1]|uniref:Uncharacterized protein n=1 Tax=Austropuccinia psidii MF-1 TaxID=1389203 RepID=A0A9Q3IB19_9BASI|nr:hypothetical protein [Austropuccinia psidii MF-1]
MSPVNLRNKPEDREGLSRTRIPGGGHLAHSGGWQNMEVNNTHSAIHFPFQQKPQTKGLEGYGSSSSAPPNPQRSFSMEHGQQETTRGEGNQDKGESSHYPSYRRTAEPDRAYIDSFRLTRNRPNKLSSGLISFRNKQISGQESPFFTIPGLFQEKTRIQMQRQDIFQPKAERVRPNDPEAVVLGERSTQEPEKVLNTSRISSLTDRNITPTQTGHNVVAPESNLHSDKLWLKMSQFAVKTQQKLDDFKRLNEIFQRNAILQEAKIKAIQEGCAQLSKASEETNKILNQVKPQPQGHALDDPYNQEENKPDALLGNKGRCPYQYQDKNDIFYSEKEALKQLQEASSWPKFSGTGEHDHMELIDYIDGLFIDVPSIPDYWIAARLNTGSKGHASIWYTEKK